MGYNQPTYKWLVFIFLGLLFPSDPITIDPIFRPGTSKWNVWASEGLGWDP